MLERRLSLTLKEAHSLLALQLSHNCASIEQGNKKYIKLRQYLLFPNSYTGNKTYAQMARATYMVYRSGLFANLSNQPPVDFPNVYMHCDFTLANIS